MPKLRGKKLLLITAIACTAVTSRAYSQSTQGLPLPPGQVVAGPVYRMNGSFVASIATGADANAYIFSTPPTASYLSSAPARAVLTSEPTQYVRFYTQGITKPVGGFIAGSDAVRGLTAAQVRDVLALPYLPDSQTIVRVPAGTCMIVGIAAPILGNFAANPAAGIPTPGPWGHGGVPQESLIGTTADPHCANAQFVPAGDFVNRQPIGPFALAYRFRAGGGNPAAVARALDFAKPPPLFTDMDGVYNSLDLLNFADPAPLRAALAQLDGEVYADVPSVEIATRRVFLDLLRDRLRPDAAAVGEPPNGAAGGSVPREWASAFGGGGWSAGRGGSHDFGFDFGGGAAGLEMPIDPWSLAGLAVAYARDGFGTAGISGDGDLGAISVALYGGRRSGAWYVEGALGYGRDDGTVHRSISFPGVIRAASAGIAANDFLSSIETGVHLPLGDGSVATPFAAFDGIVIGQDGATESGAGAIDLHFRASTTASARGILGAELARDFVVPAGPLRITARAGWAHEFADAARLVTASFDGAPDAVFTAAGAPAPRDAAAVELGLTLKTPYADLFARYNGLVGDGASIHSGIAGLRLAF